MDYLYAAIFGVVQGITEFLPISSSGHLVILHNFIDLPITNELAFDVVLHLATLLAVIWFFRREVLRLLIAWSRSLTGKPDELSRVSWLIIMATIPAAIVGWQFGDAIEGYFRSPLIVAIMLVVVGILFLIFEKISRALNNFKDLNWRQALAIGLAQVIAFIPGTSRSGITIIAGLGAGLKREEAIKFSFLLSIPIIAGASLSKLPRLGGGIAAEEYYILAIAFIFSFIAGFFAIKYFLRLARIYSLNIFAYYRFALAAVLFIYLLIR